MEKENKNIPYKKVLVTLFFCLLMGGVYAVTTISDLGINTPDVTSASLNTESLNNIFYVQPGNYSDIQRNIDLCPTTGCQVIVPSGSYNASTTIILKDKVELIGAGNPVLTIPLGNSLTAIDEDGWNISSVILINFTSDNIVSGFEIDGSGSILPPPVDPEDGDAGIYCYGCLRSEIRNNNIHDMGVNPGTYRGYSILLVFANVSDVHDNVHSTAGYEGIGVRKGSSNIVVRNNFGFSHQQHCMQASGFGDNVNKADAPFDVIFDENTCSHRVGSPNADKIIVHSADNIAITNNIVPRIQVLANSSNILISGNLVKTKFDSSNLPGIDLDTSSESSGNLIEGVIISGNSIFSHPGDTGTHRGIMLESTNSNTIRDIIISNNNIEYQGIGVYLKLDGGNNSIRNVIIEGNIIDPIVSDTAIFAVASNETFNIRFLNNIIKSDLRGVYAFADGGFNGLVMENNLFTGSYPSGILVGLADEDFDSLNNLGLNNTNITQTSPDGTIHSCGVTNAGVFECT